MFKINKNTKFIGEEDNFFDNSLDDKLLGLDTFLQMIRIQRKQRQGDKVIYTATIPKFDSWQKNILKELINNTYNTNHVQNK